MAHRPADIVSDVEWHLAQVNIGRLSATIGDPSIADFVAGLDRINTLADASPGFVWRLRTDAGDATAVRVTPDERVIVNLSVWESTDALSDYVYRSDHVAFLRRRREWFEQYASAAVALWWIKAGHRPDLDEALERLAVIDVHGPTAEAFTLRQPWPTPAIPE